MIERVVGKDQDVWLELVEKLRDRPYQVGVVSVGSQVHRIHFATGLNDAEVFSTERQFGFHFPPDLRAFLQTALFQGPQFPDWRACDEAVLRDWLDSPFQGMLFDVEHRGF